MQRRAGHFSWASAPCQTKDRAATFWLPIGRAQPGKGGHQQHILFGVRLPGQCPRLGRILKQPQSIPQPLHGSAGNKDGPLQRIGGLAAQLIGHGGQQTIVRHNRCFARVQQRKTPGSIGGLHHPRRKTGLTNTRRLLIASNAQNRHCLAQNLRHRDAKICRAVLHLWQHRHGHLQQAADLFAPGPFANVIEHGA